MKITLIPTLCAICRCDKYDQQLYPANFEPEDINFETFSARRLPDRIHYKIVQCQNCGLIRSNPILSSEDLARLYQGSFFTYAQESRYAAETYFRYAEPFLKDYAKSQIRVLEIGCGNGAFLRKLKHSGIMHVYGIEPSQEAASFDPDLKAHITRGMLAPGIFPDEFFDLICVFQVFDHVAEPEIFLNTVRRYLKTGGKVIFIQHDAGSWSAKLFKERSPIVDIEHPFLYSKKTIRKIFELQQFKIIKIFQVSNRYPLSYWLKLFPLPRLFKNFILSRMEKSIIEKLPVTLSLGNMGIVAEK